MPIRIFNKYIRGVSRGMALLLCLSLILNCAAQQNCGVAYRKDRIFIPQLNKYIIPQYEVDIKRLFYDSMMITERHTLNIERDVNGKESWRMDVTGYTFIDFRTKAMCSYSSLSEKSPKLDIRGEGMYGWEGAAESFFSPKGRNYNYSVALPDTILDGIKCRRLKGFIIRSNRDTVLTEINYFVDEFILPIAYLDKLNINNKQYSVIRMDHLDISSGIRTFSAIDVVRNNLTKQELKIFAAWRKKAKKHASRK